MRAFGLNKISVQVSGVRCQQILNPDSFVKSLNSVTPAKAEVQTLLK